MLFCTLKARKPPQFPYCYRRFSLLQFLTKVSKKIILKKLQEFTETNGLLSDFQHGGTLAFTNFVLLSRLSLDSTDPGWGSVKGPTLSPRLFNLYCSDIPTEPRIMTLQTVGISLINSDRTISRVEVSLQDHIRSVQNCYSKRELEINETKAQPIFISKRKRLRLVLQFNCKRIASNTSVKCQVMDFD